uniref:Uncharacterized protein n=1 Tax=Pediastrum angulosum TaxID=271408 RepID=A0A2U8GHM0_9CHLO|nr:hypothetical protein [Pediastrum angulosum]AWI68174.1 hypothetical protein [Pediastrum angulosum]
MPSLLLRSFFFFRNLRSFFFFRNLRSYLGIKDSQQSSNFGVWNRRLSLVGRAEEKEDSKTKRTRSRLRRSDRKSEALARSVAQAHRRRRPKRRSEKPTAPNRFFALRKEVKE